MAVVRTNMPINVDLLAPHRGSYASGKKIGGFSVSVV